MSKAAFSAPGADRRLSAFRLKHLALTPVAWYRGRGEIEFEDQRWRLERHSYSRDSLRFMYATLIDPQIIRRADLDADSVVVDVGAADGSETATFVDLYGCTVHAFEPQPPAFAQLERRFADEPRVHLHEYGLGASDAVLEMELAGDASSVYGSNRGDFASTTVQVRDIVGALDELGIERIDFLKVNIEGAEYDLFDRILASGLIDRIRYVAVQFHEWYPRAYGRRRSIRRRLGETHAEVWGYDWIWELWCHHDQPDFRQLLSAEDREAVLAEIRREVAQRKADQA